MNIEIPDTKMMIRAAPSADGQPPARGTFVVVLIRAERITLRGVDCAAKGAEGHNCFVGSSLPHVCGRAYPLPGESHRGDDADRHLSNIDGTRWNPGDSVSVGSWQENTVVIR